MLIGLLLVAFSVYLIKKAQRNKDAVGEHRAQKIGELGTRWLSGSLVLLACLWVLWFTTTSDLSEYAAVKELQPHNVAIHGMHAAAETKVELIKVTALIIIL